ncbi:protein transport protein SEC24 B-like isoform X1 [Humulus lupulus]|uniref:protein transport protein SEC24 B-like isoform X1 n=1 Tax=Humulus lupulus TaxID=3486 RepID=UPI002B40AEC3|nr:protein transport protein SEC24 B-like isoform X1 [Humulus lupulus]
MILLLFLEPLMLIVLDVQDVYTPLQTDVLVSLSEYRQHLELLLESIPTMFQNSKTAKSAFGAAIKFCHQLALELFLPKKLKEELMYLRERRVKVSHTLLIYHLVCPFYE